MIIGQVTFDYHRKGTPCSTLIVLLFWGLETLTPAYPFFTLFFFFFGFRITTTLSTERYFIYMLFFF